MMQKNWFEIIILPRSLRKSFNECILVGYASSIKSVAGIPDIILVGHDNKENELVFVGIK